MSVFRVIACVALAWGYTAAADGVDMRFSVPIDGRERVKELGAINAIVQDGWGFMWFGGENGLARYDGRTLRRYQAGDQRVAALPSDYIFQMVVDRDNVLWVATEGGLARYVADTDSFSQVAGMGDISFAVGSVSALALGNDNSLYVGAARGLYVIAPDRQSMQFFLPRPPVAMAPNIEQIRDIFIDVDNKVWLATAGMGVAVFDNRSASFEYFLNQPQEANSLAHNSVRAITQDARGRIWMGTYGGGVSLLDLEQKKFTNYFYRGAASGGIGGNVIWDIKQDSSGAIWVAVDQGGLAKFDEKSEQFTHYRHRPYDATSIISDQLRVIYEDHDKNLWLSAYPSGVSFFSRKNHVFKHYTARPDDAESISNNVILRIIEASNGVIWVGTENGLNALNPQTGRFVRYMADPSNPLALRANAVLALAEDTDGKIWVGTWGGGLHKLDPVSGEFFRYATGSGNSSSVNSDFIWDIDRDENGNMWIATETGGLNVYQKIENRFFHYLNDPSDSYSLAGNFISSLQLDSDGNVWLGGYTGVNKFDPNTKRNFRYHYETGVNNATNSKNIKAFFIDKKSRVWVGTPNNGVNILDPLTQTFSYLGVDNGLPSNNVSGILEDDEHNIWLATGGGLVKIDEQSQKITVFSQESNLAGSNFNREALLKDRAGNLYFGSTEGITRFHPSALIESSTDFPVRLVGFRIFNEEVVVDNRKVLLAPIVEADEIRLSHADMMFSLDYAALDYLAAKMMRYRYKLEGFDRDWIYAGHQATATYTNLKPGGYIFRFAASQDEKTWQEGRSLAVRVLPPPWKTWWAYSIYAVLLLAVLYWGRRHILLRARADIYKARAVLDPLTGVYNRFGLEQVVDGIFFNAETKKNIGIAIFDVDFFKSINDLCGHSAGDDVLRYIAQIATGEIRHSDSFARWGGEEFVLVCAVSSVQAGFALADKIRMAVAAYEFNLEHVPGVTLSAGFTKVQPGDSFEAALKRADNALYEAKRAGRNRVVVV